jgi:hypothetical protein
MDRAHAPMDRQRAEARPVRRSREEPTPAQRILELQQSAGNQAVAEAIATVQRHSLDPERMDEE